MKKLLFLLVLPILFSSCKGCYADYNERLQGVKKVCPNCTFVLSENYYYAVDTAKQPNVIYKVHFKDGGIHYKASDVDHLIRVN
jgi:hypothetical protein